MRDLKADLELCNKATHGKWQASYDDDIKDDVRVCQVENGECVCCLALMGNYDYDLGEWHYGDIAEWRANADFIAAARTGWPEAIERAIKAEELAHKLGQLVAEEDDVIKQASTELAALREENEELKKALELIIDDMGEDSCPYEYDYVDKPECENCPHDHEIHVDTERDVRCWKEYYLAKAGEDL